MFNAWVIQEEDSEMPEWLTANLSSKCSCGKPIENWYNAKGRITSRRCSDENCKYVLAERIADMCTFMKIEGVKGKTALKILISHPEIKNQFEALPYIMDTKPLVGMFNYMQSCLVEGYQDKWKDIIGSYETPSELVSKYNGFYRDVIDKNKDIILGGESYVEFRKTWKPKFKPMVTGNVMLTNAINGFENRNDFGAGLLMASNGLIDIRVCGKRKTGVMALIKDGGPVNSKEELALECNIPIYTSKEFEKHVAKMLQEKLKTEQPVLFDE